MNPVRAWVPPTAEDLSRVADKQIAAGLDRNGAAVTAASEARGDDRSMNRDVVAGIHSDVAGDTLG